MKKAILIKIEDTTSLVGQNLVVKVYNQKLIPGVNLCKCCYVKVRNKSEHISDIINLALEIKHDENENTEESLPQEDLDFLFGADCDYDVWVYKELIGGTFIINQDKNNSRTFVLSSKDVKTVEEYLSKQLKKRSVAPVKDYGKPISKEDMKKIQDGYDNLDKNLGKTNKLVDDEVTKKLQDLFGLENPLQLLKLPFDRNELSKKMDAILGSEEGLNKILEIANLTKSKLDNGTFGNKDTVWNEGMKKRTETLIEALSGAKNIMKKTSTIEEGLKESLEEDPKDAMLKQMCKTFGVSYDDYKEFENSMNAMLGLGSKIADIKNNTKIEKEAVTEPITKKPKRVQLPQVIIGVTENKFSSPELKIVDVLKKEELKAISIDTDTEYVVNLISFLNLKFGLTNVEYLFTVDAVMHIKHTLGGDFKNVIFEEKRVIKDDVFKEEDSSSSILYIRKYKFKLGGTYIPQLNRALFSISPENSVFHSVAFKEYLLSLPGADIKHTGEILLTKAAISDLVKDPRWSNIKFKEYTGEVSDTGNSTSEVETNNIDEDSTLDEELWFSPVTLFDGSEDCIVENNVFKEPFLNILKYHNLTNGNDNDDLIIIRNNVADIRDIGRLIFKMSDEDVKSLTVIAFGDYYYISVNNAYKELLATEYHNGIELILSKYTGAELFILNNKL